MSKSKKAKEEKARARRRAKRQKGDSADNQVFDPARILQPWHKSGEIYQRVSLLGKSEIQVIDLGDGQVAVLSEPRGETEKLDFGPVKMASKKTTEDALAFADAELARLGFILLEQAPSVLSEHPTIAKRWCLQNGFGDLLEEECVIREWADGVPAALLSPGSEGWLTQFPVLPGAPRARQFKALAVAMEFADRILEEAGWTVEGEPDACVTIDGNRFEPALMDYEANTAVVVLPGTFGWAAAHAARCTVVRRQTWSAGDWWSMDHPREIGEDDLLATDWEVLDPQPPVSEFEVALLPPPST